MKTWYMTVDARFARFASRARLLPPNTDDASSLAVYTRVAQVSAALLTLAAYALSAAVLGPWALTWAWLPAAVLGLAAGAFWPMTMGLFLYLASFYLLG